MQRVVALLYTVFMNGAFNTPGTKRKPAINITPLIDVMFLLLIFFMVSSTFKEYTGMDITLPKASQSSAQNASMHEIVVDREGNYYLKGAPKQPDQLRTELAALLKDNLDSTIVLRADTEADFGQVLRAMDIAREVGGDRLIIPTDLLSRADAPGK